MLVVDLPILVTLKTDCNEGFVEANQRNGTHSAALSFGFIVSLVAICPFCVILFLAGCNACEPRLPGVLGLDASLDRFRLLPTEQLRGVVRVVPAGVLLKPNLLRRETLIRGIDSLLVRPLRCRLGDSAHGRFAFNEKG